LTHFQRQILPNDDRITNRNSSSNGYPKGAVPKRYSAGKIHMLNRKAKDSAITRIKKPHTRTSNQNFLLLIVSIAVRRKIPKKIRNINISNIKYQGIFNQILFII
jgi:hypothetical protein